MNDFLKGMKKSIPIFLGYFAVSFSFGVFCNINKIAPITAIVMSLTNLTSSGQFAGAKLIISVASYIEIAVTVLLINLRYALMSLSLSQHLKPKTKTWQRLLFGFGITDEIYAVAIKEEEKVSAKYMFGLIALPIIGWTLGTLFGVLFSDILPQMLQNAFGIALYAMFIAIFLPDCTKSKSISIIVAISIILSCCLEYVPYINLIPLGFKIIISTVVASLIGADFFKIKEEEQCMN